jgi:hypothetical protein
MNQKMFVLFLVVSALMFVSTSAVAQSLDPAAPQAPLGTGFTYQGQLKTASGPVNGICDLQFSLWDAAGSGSPPTGGAQIGATHTLPAVTVTNGLFTVILNTGSEFGGAAFTGEARWLQVAVRCPAGTGTYATLSPRQALTATPYALSLMPNATINGLTNTGNLSFGNATRQMLNLWGTRYGVGVQSYDLYFRTDTDAGFAWYAGGAHRDAHYDPGCSGPFCVDPGLTLMTLDRSGGLKINTPVTAGAVTAATVDAGTVSATTNAALPGPAVAGVNNGSGYALYGEAASGTAVLGVNNSSSMSAVRAKNTGGGPGVYADATSGTAVLGVNNSDSMSAVTGRSAGGSPGVEGISSFQGCSIHLNELGGPRSSNRTNWAGFCVGVYGESQGIIQGAGVRGFSEMRPGVEGVSVSGIGVSGSSTSGYAGHFDGRVRVQGDLEFTGNLVGGNKLGYVSDFALNDGQEALSAGDVVAVVGYTTPVVGTIPVARVIKASSPYQTGVVGVVDQHVIPGNALQFHDEPAAPGEYLNIVTLGMYRGIKVDAGFAAIHAGDLLVSSPHAGYAMKATDRTQAIGAIVGKALGDLATGEGALPVIVTLQ